MSEQITACPFCGHVGLDFAEGSTFRWMVASCQGCGASCGEERVQTSGDGSPDVWWEAAKGRAIKTWNTRATQPQAPQGAVTGWQPIETAPKDGSVILAYWACELNGKPIAGDKCYALTMWGGGDWISTDDSDISFAEPTHWKPLDAAPETPEGKK